MPTAANTRRSIRLTKPSSSHITLSEQSDVEGGGPFVDIAQEPHFLFLRDGNNLKITTPDGKFNYIVSFAPDANGKQDILDDGSDTIEGAMDYLTNFLS